MEDYKKRNRERLINLLGLTNPSDKLAGWQKSADLAVGGLLAFGFSRSQSNLLLVVSSSGRGLIDCNTGEKVSRDYGEYEGLDELGVYCKGIGAIEGEDILLSGGYGGGLPHQNSAGESIEVVAPEWPEYEVILCESGKSVYSEPGACYTLAKDYFRAYGFSWCGNYIAAGTGSDVIVWKRGSRL